MASSLTLSELASQLAGEIIRGAPDTVLTGMAALDAAGPGDISFLGNEKYRGQFLTTRAAAVLVPRGLNEGPPSTALIAVENPSLAFATVVAHFAAARRAFQPGVDPSARVSPTAKFDPAKVRIRAGAVIEAHVTLGDGCDIGPNVVLQENCRLGRDCRIHANAVVREDCVLGDRVILQPGAIIGSDGFGYEWKDGRHLKIDQVGIVEIHDDVEIGANTTIDRARFGKTIIGEGSKIDNLVQIAHNVVIGRHCLVVSQTGISGSSKFEDHVTAGGQVGVAGHVTVGSRAILTARTGVTADLPGGVVYAGKPAQPLREELKDQARLRRLGRRKEPNRPNEPT